jgi:hypothetical protein
MALPVRNNRKTFFPNEPWFLSCGSRMEPVMAIFVVVHGAWGGAQGFRKVRTLLRVAGRTRTGIVPPTYR